MSKNIFIEKKIYIVDEDALYFAIKDLSYTEFMDFQSQYFQEAMNKNLVTCYLERMSRKTDTRGQRA